MNKNWHVVYTRPRYEKLTSRLLEKKGFEYFLPLRMEMHQWHDRKEKVHTPVFPAYLFVHVDILVILKVYNIDGFVKFIFGEDKPDIVSPEALDALKRAIVGEYEVTSERFHLGDQVKVSSGPMKGLKGHLLMFASKSIINIGVIDKSVLVNNPIALYRKNSNRSISIFY